MKLLIFLKTLFLNLFLTTKPLIIKIKLLIENNVCSKIHNTPQKLKKKLFTFTDSNDYLNLFSDNFFKKQCPYST